jgi:hypothetical protein
VLRAVYGISPSGIADAVELLLPHRELIRQDSDAVAAAWLSFRAHPRLGFTDGMILESARKAGYLPLGTFDRGLARLTGTAIPRR